MEEGPILAMVLGLLTLGRPLLGGYGIGSGNDIRWYYCSLS